jgi:site-specific recombinase XerD
VKEQLGHEYLSTTQHYTHIGDMFIRKNLNAVVEANLKKRMDILKGRRKDSE